MIDRRIIEAYLVPLSPIPTGMQPSGRLPAPMRAVFFDVYGTLFISGSGDIGTARARAKEAALGSLLKRFGIDKEAASLTKTFIDRIETVHRQKKAHGVEAPEVEYDRIWMTVLGTEDRDLARRFAVEYELVVNPVWPMPGAERTLAGLKQRGILLGIVSNAQFFTPWLFSWFFGKSPEALGIDAGLQFYSYRFGAAKPSQVLFDAAGETLKKLGSLPAEALYVGNDMRNDVLAAGRAGFKTALFAGDGRSLRRREDDPECRNASPDLVVTALEQILDHV